MACPFKQDSLDPQHPSGASSVGRSLHLSGHTLVCLGWPQLVGKLFGLCGIKKKQPILGMKSFPMKNVDFQLPCTIGRFGQPGLTFLCGNCGLELRSGGLLWVVHESPVYCSLRHTLLPWFSNLSVRENLTCLLKHRLQGFTPVSVSVGLG